MTSRMATIVNTEGSSTFFCHESFHQLPPASTNNHQLPKRLRLRIISAQKPCYISGMKFTSTPVRVDLRASRWPGGASVPASSGRLVAIGAIGALGASRVEFVSAFCGYLHQVAPTCTKLHLKNLCGKNFQPRMRLEWEDRCVNGPFSNAKAWRAGAATKVARSSRTRCVHFEYPGVQKRDCAAPLVSGLILFRSHNDHTGFPPVTLELFCVCVKETCPPCCSPL